MVPRHFDIFFYGDYIIILMIVKLKQCCSQPHELLFSFLKLNLPLIASQATLNKHQCLGDIQNDLVSIRLEEKRKVRDIVKLHYLTESLFSGLSVFSLPFLFPFIRICFINNRKHNLLMFKFFLCSNYWKILSCVFVFILLASEN